MLAVRICVASKRQSKDAASAPPAPGGASGGEGAVGVSKREKAKLVSCGESSSYILASPSMAPSAIALVRKWPCSV